MVSKINRSLGTTLLFSAIAASGNALAAGFYIQEQNAAGVGRAQAGNVVAADDASTIYFNPAGLSELPGVQAAGAIDTIIPSAGLTDKGTVNRSLGAYQANPSSLGFSSPGTSNGGNPGSATPVPDLYLSAQIGDSPFTVGFGLTAPFGFVSKFTPDSFARYDSIESNVMTIDLAPTIAWRVNDWLSIGLGIDEQYAKVKLSQALPNPLVPGGPTPATDGSLAVTGSDWTTGFNAGVLVKPNINTKIGFSYRSGITHQIAGTATFAGLAGPLAARNGSVAANAALNLPDIYSVGISRKFTPELTFLLEGDYYTWSRFKQIDVHLLDGSGDLVTLENYRDTYSMALGAEYQLTDQLKLKSGVKYDQTPTVDAYRDTRVPDGDRIWVSAGLHYQLTSQLGIDAGYAHIFMKDASVNVTRSFYAGSIPVIPTSSAIKAQTNVALDILSIGFAYKF
jgi:long-chain fatty acid transport protein